MTCFMCLIHCRLNNQRNYRATIRGLIFQETYSDILKIKVDEYGKDSQWQKYLDNLQKKYK